MGKLDQLYARLPVTGQNVAVSTYGLYWNWVRFGPGYKKFVTQYRARDRFSADEWQRWQQMRLNSFLTSVLDIPYYANHWSESAKAAARAGQLSDLPLLEKQPLRDDVSQFLRPGSRPLRRMISRTSGSTGTPIDNHWLWQEVREARAVREVRSAGWAGVSFAEPRATFSGRFVEPDPHSSGPFHRYNRVERQVYFSAFHLRPDTAHQYVDALRQHRTRWLTGYAVSFYLLAEMILEQKLDVPKSLQAVVTTSEKVTDEMRDVMQRAFGCRVFEEYSTVENCLFASECEAGNLHVSPDVSVVEILRPDGTPCDPEEPGEVVTTCLMRNYQPFVRYRVGDIATWSAVPCGCGRSMPVLKEVVGRLEDVLIGPDGRRMVRFHGVFVNQPNVREGQVIQETRTRIRVKVVPTEAFTAADVADIQNRVQQRMGEVEVVVQPVTEIPRSKAGKFKAVINLTSQNTSTNTGASEYVAH
ncbi:phenylacetate--CoA ligase family protein [Novipirellula sp.]|uniref:phenylacetate--CoA ligase family protein n=1 Tax=Novipirellula sp. TaxID=2795430 RepID=UPI0035636FE1